jgi:hypothetical protein
VSSIYLGSRYARTKPIHPNKKSTNTKQNLKKVLKKVSREILTKIWKNYKKRHLSLFMLTILDLKRRQKMG